MTSQVDPPQNDAMSAKAFRLERDVDETGVSGTGIVAEGVEFSDGVVALRWTSVWPTSVVFHERGMDSVDAVHGHGGKTRVVWEPAQADERDGLIADAYQLIDWWLNAHDDHVENRDRMSREWIESMLAWLDKERPLDHQRATPASAVVRPTHSEITEVVAQVLYSDTVIDRAGKIAAALLAEFWPGTPEPANEGDAT